MFCRCLSVWLFCGPTSADLANGLFFRISAALGVEPENALSLTLLFPFSTGGASSVASGNVQFDTRVKLSCDNSNGCQPEITTESCLGCGGAPAASGSGSGSGSEPCLGCGGVSSGQPPPSTQPLTKVAVLVGLRLVGDELVSRTVLEEEGPSASLFNFFGDLEHLETVFLDGEQHRAADQMAVEVAVTLAGPAARLADILAFQEPCDHGPLVDAVRACIDLSIDRDAAAALCAYGVDAAQHSCAGKSNEWQISRWSEVDDGFREEVRLMRRFYGPLAPPTPRPGSEAPECDGSMEIGHGVSAECSCSGREYCSVEFDPLFCRGCYEVQDVAGCDDQPSSPQFSAHESVRTEALYAAASCRFHCFNVTTTDYVFTALDNGDAADCDGDVYARMNQFVACGREEQHSRNDFCSCAKAHYYFLSPHTLCFDGDQHFSQKWDEFESLCWSSTADAFAGGGGGGGGGHDGAVGTPPTCCDPVDNWCDDGIEGACPYRYSMYAAVHPA